MAYSSEISDQVQQTLLRLAQSSPARCRDLARLLLRLEKSPRPPGSRKLLVQTEADSEEREWIHGGFSLLYQITDSKRLVRVGVAND